jgi:hypothetical protein
MKSTDLLEAREALRDREQIPIRDWESRIGWWRSGDPAPGAIPGLADWAAERGQEAVIWTALRPKFGGQEYRPSKQQVVEYLQALTGEAREKAESYVRRAPEQIATEYRRAIEEAMGWSSRSR